MLTESEIVIIGGSVGGLSAARALTQAGWSVRVLEKASQVSSPTGAGLGLDSISAQVIKDLGLQEPFLSVSASLELEAYRWVDPRPRPSKAVTLVENWEHHHRSMLWSDLHKMLLKSLPQDILHFGHEVIGIDDQCESGGKVKVTAVSGGQRKEFVCSAVVAADGINSFARRQFVCEDKKRYSGMIAWRGVVDASTQPQLLQKLQEDFHHLGNAIIFDIGMDCMNLIYMLPGALINYLWYRSVPEEPDLKGQSVTLQASKDEIAKMITDAEATWTPAFVDLIKATEKPFVNVIYDKDPLSKWVYGRVALVGEAAHCTTPHGSRSTNMSIQDAGALLECFRRHAGDRDAVAALQEFQHIRLPATSREVLFSRHVGELRQGRWVDPQHFSWPDASPEAKALLLNAKRSESDYKQHASEILQKLCEASRPPIPLAIPTN
ncbi:hypothetical protein WJX73_008898 [Symbiochloris irregularis]|uniref:FAD-binding domain-containing protein n=1 Tax=Symbiochloris irregularis TaxID=706552 RepID=A0AAW1PEX8_9CHLO